MSNWYVITGGPSSGKTTTVNLLHERGYATTVEHARHYIDLQRIEGRSVEEVRGRQREFQCGVFAMQLEQEASLDPDETVFLDRALPDSLAYHRFLDLEPHAQLLDALPRVSYRKVFILDLLPLAPDYARIEDAAAQSRIHALLTEVYRELPSPVVTVPVLSPADRVAFILDRL
ncbi:AAA family ATPase [Agrococcus sediminis]|uniref:ATP-binding protein n=1 Tax=Agrococcus TaxID=46352 RepID=UPI002485C612|nr:ATP-binding protein [Agrococcus sp. SCSIO52902]